MAEPTATSAGISLTVLSVTLLGPLAGPWALIAFSALAGAMWPLLAARTETGSSAGWLLLRCTLTAIVLTAFIAGALERIWGMPANEFLGPVALLIGAVGNGWSPVFDAIGVAAKVFIGKIGGESK